MMSFVGHGWRTGGAGDITGGATTATVASLSTPTDARKKVITQTVTGTNYDATCVIYANYSPLPTTFLSATQVRTTAFNTTPDSGGAGTIPVGVRKGSLALSNTINFTAT
jgi:hypothetical protein